VSSPQLPGVDGLAGATEVALVRHGLPAVDGSKDPGLSELGFAQAQAVADYLVVERPARVFSSQLQRARDTAAPLAEQLGAAVVIDEDLREWDSYSPQPFYRPPEALAGSPRLTAYREGRFEDFLPPHDQDLLQRRMAGAVRRAANDHPDELIVVVSHGGAINSLLALVVGTDRRFFFDPGYTCVSRIRVLTDGRLVLVSINETAHLRGLVAATA
jgi:probable phosphoglycerate mutase